MAPPNSRPEPDFVLVAPDPATESVERLRRQALRLLTETTGADSEKPAAEDKRGAAGQDGEPNSGTAPSMIAGLLAMPAAFVTVVLLAVALFGKPGDSAGTHAAAAESLIQPAPAARAAPTTLVSAAARASGVIALADDARIQSIALDGDRVALHVESPSGREIVVYDYREGRQIAAAAIETFSTDAPDTLSMLTGPPPASAAPAPEAATSPAAPPAPAPVFTGAPRLKPHSTL